ncbi:MAG: hypothetical protein IPH91_05645 [Elusimicrobia bacterium]|jgi:hypothetical protein|nr:hypothetical protein [Elusimicrobiota bacterium]MBK8651062.1 hypothetical protein [Elusimicrobiota bacterium]
MKNTWKRGLAVFMVGGLATLGLAPSARAGHRDVRGEHVVVAVGVGTLLALAALSGAHHHDAHCGHRTVIRYEAPPPRHHHGRWSHRRHGGRHDGRDGRGSNDWDSHRRWSEDRSGRHW